MNGLEHLSQPALYIVRHGRTALNVDERYLGALDPPLDAHGFEQAAALVPMLRDRASVVVSSPKRRALQTAEILASGLNLPLTVVQSFAERDVGVYEGLSKREARLNYPDLWERNITRQWDVGPPNGESIKTVFERVAQGLEFLDENFRGHSVVLVAHGFVAKVIRALLTDLSWDAFFDYSLKNGSVERYPAPRMPSAERVVNGPHRQPGANGAQAVDGPTLPSPA